LERRLAAILAADVVGYSRLMEQDEAGTFARLRQRRTELVEPAVGRHHGRIFKLMGDGLLAEFGSAVDPVECAVAVQQAMTEANREAPDSLIEMRIGVHVGDVIVESEDRHGEAVNIAARLQELAEPSGICASRRVMELARQKVAFGFELRGEERLKNMAEPISVYSIRLDGTPSKQVPPLPDKPSIAILPFKNLSADPEQDYFADGIVEEIITALSRMGWLFVIARNSSFTYKGRAIDVKQVGRELGVRYVLEGSVRKSGRRLRIMGQLIDATTGAHLWADKFDGELEDVFDLQDHVTASVVGAIAPKLEQAEIERAKRKPTESLDVYDCYLRGLAELHRFTKEASSEALSHFRRAIELDPNFAAAYGMAARSYAQRKAGRWMADPASEIAEARRLSYRAIELGPDNALALCTGGFALADVVNELEDGDALIDRAMALNPNLAWAWIFSGWVKVSLGEPEIAIERLSHAMRLSPHDPYLFGMLSAIASAHLAAGRYADALSWAEKSFRVKPDYLLAACIIAVSRALAGRIDDARNSVMVVLRLDPDLRISNLKSVISYLRERDFEKWVAGLRKAGLPE
jgi:TolB-like protein/class 3 adenylate cyclase/tetratricopeptide (TPR) repeat protein